MKERKPYSMTPEAKEQRLVASAKASDLKRLSTDIKLANVAEKLSNSLDKEDFDKLSAKDKAVILGIVYDKLYRNEKEHRQIQAIQINIKAPEGATDTLNLDIKPTSVE